MDQSREETLTLSFVEWPLCVGMALAYDDDWLPFARTLVQALNELPAGSDDRPLTFAVTHGQKVVLERQAGRLRAMASRAGEEGA